ncbi:MAG: VRR-NUC domain-containing protein [Endozoicomonas sp.]
MMPETDLRTDLPPGYYLDNFEKLRAFVHQQYDDLLSPAEHAFFQSWEKLSEDARKLYVRLISRKSPVFRSDKFNYEEIQSIPAAADELDRNGFLTINPELSLADLCQLVTKPELTGLFSEHLSSSKATRKADLVAILESLDLPIPGLPFTTYKPLCSDTIQRLLFLFFGNTRQDLTEFVLQDLGLTVFENYSLSSTDRLFKSRQELEQGLSVSRLYYQALDAESTELLQLAQQIPAAPEHPVLYRRYCKLINLVAREAERTGQLEKALPLFTLSSLPPARERCARILEKLGRKDQSLVVCEQIIQEPAGDLELAFAERFRNRLTRQKRVKAQSIPENRISLPLSEERVEVAVQHYFLQQGQECHYVENTLIPGLTGLAFWDVIFAPITGAFFHPFQNKPADLLTPDFYQKRSGMISQRLTELGETSMLPGLKKTFREKQGIANSLVNWSLLSKELVEQAVRHIPKEHLLLMIKKLMQDITHNRNGFPDLILFDPSGGAYRWVEVKGPSDRLQENQKRWFQFFLTHGMPCEVVHVEWLIRK